MKEIIDKEYFKFISLLFIPLGLVFLTRFIPQWACNLTYIVLGLGWLAVVVVINPLFMSFKALSLWGKAGHHLELYVNLQEAKKIAKALQEGDRSWLNNAIVTRETIKRNKRLGEYWRARTVLSSYIDQQQSELEDNEGLLQNLEELWETKSP